MLGLIIHENERREIEYMVKRELEEVLMDLEDQRLDPFVKQALKGRYRVLFNILRRVATGGECSKYILNHTKYIDKQ